MNITYEKNGDYLIPNLIPNPEPEGELRKFGLMRKHYLKEHRSGIYQTMLLSGKLKGHLLMMQEQAETQFDLLVKQMAEQEGVTEHLKEENQMLWVQRMNNILDKAKKDKLWRITATIPGNIDTGEITTALNKKGIQTVVYIGEGVKLVDIYSKTQGESVVIKEILSPLKVKYSVVEIDKKL